MGVNVSEVFGQNVFDESVMKNRLPEATYNEIKKINARRWRYHNGISQTSLHRL